MHIVLCTDGVFPHAMGGMQRHSRLLAEHLAAMPGVRLTVVHPHDRQVFPTELGIVERPVQGIDPERFYLAELYRYSGRVARELDSLGGDAILSQGFSVWRGIGKYSDRLLVNPHGLEMFQGLTWKDRAIGLPFRFFLRRILRRSRFVVSLGGKLTTILQRQVRGSRARVVVLPNAVSVPVTAPEPLRTQGSLELLFVGRFAQNKGLDLLVEVARKLEPKGGFRFVLAGDGPLLAGIRAAGVPTNVELAGRVDDERLAALYRSCDAFVLPTRFEGMPTVVLEAMAEAKPIVVSDVGATAELVDMHNGYLIPPGDGEALYQALLALAERPVEVRAKMGAYGRQRVLERFTWPVVAKAHVELFAGTEEA